MQVGVVISTLGRSAVLDLVLESLVKQTVRPVDVVVVDQSGADEVAEVVERWSRYLPVRRITTKTGVSIGRNAGWLALSPCDIVAFPDDDCTYPPDAFARALVAFKEHTVWALSGRLVGADNRLAFDGGASEIDRKTVWTRAIEATTFYRLDALELTGGFSESLGIGAPTPWQSGEGTDLLLRVLDAGGRALYEPSIRVTEHQRETSPGAYLAKVRKYARGTGRVYAMHYSLSARVLVVAKPVLAALALAAHGDLYGAKTKMYAALGRLEGQVRVGPGTA